MVVLKRGVRRDQALRSRPRGHDDVLVAQHRQQAQTRPLAGLAGPEHVSLAAVLEIEARELEPVCRGGNAVESLTNQIVNKLLHQPIMRLKEAGLGEEDERSAPQGRLEG